MAVAIARPRVAYARHSASRLRADCTVVVETLAVFASGRRLAHVVPRSGKTAGRGHPLTRPAEGYGRQSTTPVGATQGVARETLPNVAGGAGQSLVRRQSHMGQRVASSCPVVREAGTGGAKSDAQAVSL